MTQVNNNSYVFLRNKHMYETFIEFLTPSEFFLFIRTRKSIKTRELVPLKGFLEEIKNYGERFYPKYSIEELDFSFFDEFAKIHNRYRFFVGLCILLEKYYNRIIITNENIDFIYYLTMARVEFIVNDINIKNTQKLITILGKIKNLTVSSMQNQFYSLFDQINSQQKDNDSQIFTFNEDFRMNIYLTTKNITHVNKFSKNFKNKIVCIKLIDYLFSKNEANEHLFNIITNNKKSIKYLDLYSQNISSDAFSEIISSNIIYLFNNLRWEAVVHKNSTFLPKHENWVAAPINMFPEYKIIQTFTNFIVINCHSTNQMLNYIKQKLQNRNYMSLNLINPALLIASKVNIEINKSTDLYDVLGSNNINDIVIKIDKTFFKSIKQPKIGTNAQIISSKIIGIIFELEINERAVIFPEIGKNIEIVRIVNNQPDEIILSNFKQFSELNKNFNTIEFRNTPTKLSSSDFDILRGLKHIKINNDYNNKFIEDFNLNISRYHKIIKIQVESPYNFYEIETLIVKLIQIDIKIKLMISIQGCPENYNSRNLQEKFPSIKIYKNSK